MQIKEISRLEREKKQLQSRVEDEIKQRVNDAKKQIKQSKVKTPSQASIVIPFGSKYHRVLEQARGDHTITLSALQASTG